MLLDDVTRAFYDISNTFVYILLYTFDKFPWLAGLQPTYGT